MLSTLRSGRSVCSWTSVTKLSKFQPRFVCPHTNFGRVSLTGRRGGQQILKRYAANEAKTTVRAVPVESTRAGLTGTTHAHSDRSCYYSIKLCLIRCSYSADSGTVQR